jgi:hypothetical protein
MWANYEEPKTVVVVEETERKCNYKKVLIHHVERTFFVQDSAALALKRVTELEARV